RAAEDLAGDHDADGHRTDGRDADAPAPAGGTDSTTLPLLGKLLGEHEQQLLDEITAIMSLLEGHADVVMDEVGPGVVRSVAHIRTVFDRRRDSPGPVDRVLRRLLGLDR